MKIEDLEFKQSEVIFIAPEKGLLGSSSGLEKLEAMSVGLDVPENRYKKGDICFFDKERAKEIQIEDLKLMVIDWRYIYCTVK